MLCDNTSWVVVYALRGVLCVVGLLVIVLMQKAEHDRSINRLDSKPLRCARRVLFVAITTLVVIFLLTDLSSVALLMLFSATAALLVVDIIALNRRPPATGRKAATGTSAINQLATFFRNGPGAQQHRRDLPK